MKLTKFKFVITGFLAIILSACMNETRVKTATHEVDRLIVHENGKMEFRSRYLNEDQVVIYSDGKGGERAAVKIDSLEPIRPAFYRDHIIVERRNK